MIFIKRTDKTLTIQGHASDGLLVTKEATEACASITAITQTMLDGIIFLCEETPNYELERGHFRLDLQVLHEKALFLVDVFVNGAKLIQSAYSDYINVQS